MKHGSVGLGRRVADVRRNKGMKQKELADVMNFSRSAMCQIEKGERMPSVRRLRAICQTLECSADYLLGLSDEPAVKSGDTHDLYPIYERIRRIEKALQLLPLAMRPEPYLKRSEELEY